MGRGKRNGGGLALAESGGRTHRLPDVLRGEQHELRLLLAWSHESDEAGRSALPEVGDVGQVSVERVNEDEMIRLYIAGKQPFMTYPGQGVHGLRDQLRPTAPPRCTVTAVDREQSEIVVRLSRLDVV